MKKPTPEVSVDVVRQAIFAAGRSPSAVAAALRARGSRVKRQHVEHWLKAGKIPPAEAALLERVGGRMVCRWDLFPDDWHRIWPELKGAEGAPPVPEPAKEGA